MHEDNDSAAINNSNVDDVDSCENNDDNDKKND